MADVLALTAHLPEHEFGPGRVVVEEGATDPGIWVLVSGSLSVRKGETVVSTITEPGALVGEISVLLDTTNGATVEAIEPTRLRYAIDGRGLMSDPEVMGHVAVGLAQRLNLVTSYLADLKHQYDDAPGLSMVSDVLSRLVERTGPPARPGSVRDPDPPY